MKELGVPRPNDTKRKLSQGGVVFGAFVLVPSPRIVELCGIAGMDYMIADAEHAPIDFGIAEEMCRAAEAVGITPMVRVSSHEPKAVLRYLDIGYQGLMFPQVNSAAEARAAAAAAHYPPDGSRGVGPGRAAWYGQASPLREFVASANDEILVIAQLEHREALGEIAEIVETPGIDAFEIGTADLSASFGYPGHKERSEVVEAVDTFVRAVLAAGKVIGDTVGTTDEARTLVQAGYRMLDCSFVGIATKALRELSLGVRKETAKATAARQ